MLFLVGLCGNTGMDMIQLRGIYMKRGMLMKNKLLWKQSLLILLISLLFLVGLPINSIKADAADGETRQELDVKIVSAVPRSCHVVYTIKGIKYESDKAGSRINQMAWTHMSTENRRAVMDAYHWCIDRRKSDFGREFSGEMADWFNEQCGWKQASETFEEKLMNKYNKELVKEYGNIDEHYQKNYAPDLGDDLQNSVKKYPEVQALYDEQMMILTWERSAFNAIQNAVFLRQKAAILSTSGDMIQLITDRVLVPNITVSGTGGFATSIATEVFGYAASITGCMDNVINNLVGERTTSTDASQIITEMNMALELNEKILKKCDEKLESLKTEIENKYKELEEEYNSKEKAEREQYNQRFASLKERVQAEEDSEISAKLRFYNNELSKLDPNSEEYSVLYDEYWSYFESQQSAAEHEMNTWNETYQKDVQNLLESRPKYPEIIGDTDSYLFSEGRAPYNDLNMSIAKFELISSNINNHIDEINRWLEEMDSYCKEVESRYTAAKEAYVPVLSKMKVFDINNDKSYQDIMLTYDCCLDVCVTRVYYEQIIHNYKQRLSLFDQRHKKYNSDIYKAREEYLKYQSAYIEAWENYKGAEEEIKALLNSLPDYINKQNILYESDGGTPYLDTRYFEHPSELFKADVSSTGRFLDEIMNKYNDLGRKMNLYHSQIVVYQDVLIELSSKMQPGSFDVKDYGSDIKPYYELVGIYGEITDTTTQIPYENESGGGTLTTRLLWADFNGRGFSHESLMKCYEQLCVNEQDYSNKVAEKEHEYFVLTQNITHLANNRGLNSYAHPSVRAGVKSSYASNSASLMSKPKLLASSASEPDPYDDLVAPMIQRIEAARTYLGQVSNPEFVSNILFTVDCKLSGESVDNLKDYITVNSEFVNIDSAEAYYYGELLTGKFELGSSFVPKIYYSFKEGAIAEGNVEVSIAGVDKYYIKYGEDDKGTYVTVDNILFSIEQSQEGNATEKHDFSITDVTKATLTSNGKIVTKCKNCGQVSDTKIIYYPKTIQLSATTYTYDGKAKQPSVSVVGADGKTISSANYTVTYPSDRKNVGKYTVQVVFKGNYSGTKSLTFVINPVKTTIKTLKKGNKSFKVTWTKKSAQVTGYELQYSTSATFASGNKTVNVSSYKKVNRTIKNLKSKKKYYVRVRTYKKVSGTKYYSDWSAKKKVTTK